MAFVVKEEISLLFLDVDGVLNIANKSKVVSLSKSHIEILNTILTSTDITCKICISSAWRKFNSAISYLKRSLKNIAHIDVNDVIIGHTPDLSINNENQSHQNHEQIRISEIQTYLKNNKRLNSQYAVVSYCVIDDMYLSAMDNFVKIDPKKGITAYNAEQAISILNGDIFDQVQVQQKLRLLQLKPKIKLLFVLNNELESVDSESCYLEQHMQRLKIIESKTKCKTVRNDDLRDMKAIVGYIDDMKCDYNVESWAVLDLIDLYSKLPNDQFMSSHFVKVDSKQGLILNDVMNAVSILNKWS